MRVELTISNISFGKDLSRQAEQHQANKQLMSFPSAETKMAASI